MTETIEDPWRALHGRNESEIDLSGSEMSVRPSKHVWAMAGSS